MITVFAVSGGAAYVIAASASTNRPAPPSSIEERLTDGQPVMAAVPSRQAEGVPNGPGLLFLRTMGDAFRRLAWTATGTSNGPAHVSDFQCQRVYFAAGRGLCVGTSFTGGALVFDRDLNPLHPVTGNGIASRARVSADGRYGSMTFFVTGDSYADAGFSTRTTIVDMASGAPIADLETFSVTRDGAPFRAVDFNFWGVTFLADSNRFYATLGTRSETFLVKGDIAARQLVVIRSNVECPSLSPDGTRLAFKKRLPSLGLGRVTWRLAVIDLASMRETLLEEPRSVDDQVEWLDDDHVLYSLPDAGPPATIRPDLWLLDVRGGPPMRIQLEAMSAVAVR